MVRGRGAHSTPIPQKRDSGRACFQQSMGYHGREWRREGNTGRGGGGELLPTRRGLGPDGGAASPERAAPRAETRKRAFCPAEAASSEVWWRRGHVERSELADNGCGYGLFVFVFVVVSAGFGFVVLVLWPLFCVV